MHELKTAIERDLGVKVSQQRLILDGMVPGDFDLLSDVAAEDDVLSVGLVETQEETPWPPCLALLATSQAPDRGYLPENGYSWLAAGSAFQTSA